MQAPLSPTAPVGAGAHTGPGHCPGHGPMDPPHHINWWQGILGVDNAKAQSDDFVDQLFWRYEDKSNECDPKNQPPPFIATLLNFGIFAFILYRYGRKPLVEALAKRKTGIMAEIDAATRLRDEAEDRLDDFEDKLEHVEDRLELLMKEYAEQAHREKERLVAEAGEARARMRRDAEFRIEQELKAAKEQLLREAVQSAVVAAEKLIQTRVTAADMDRLAEEYLQNVGPAMSEAAGAGTRAS